MPLSVATDSRRLGLQTLIAAAAADVVVPGSRNVATRTIAASRRAVYGERDPEPFAEEEGSGGRDVEDEEGGCWVMYGWRRRLLPPLIPSLRRAGSSRRTRTADGRVVVTREPAPQRGRIVARRLEGRLILNLVDSSPVPSPPRQRRPHPSIAQETDVIAAEPADEKAAISADIGSARGGDLPAAVRAPIVPSSSPVGSAASPVACFEAVIGTSPLRQMPVSVPSMVH